MNQLRKRLLTAFAAGTAEELARTLALIAALSTHPKRAEPTITFHVRSAPPKLMIRIRRQVDINRSRHFWQPAAKNVWAGPKPGNDSPSLRNRPVALAPRLCARRKGPNWVFAQRNKALCGQD
jgi:hypothetical protein